MDEQRVFTTGTRPRATPPENRAKLDEMERRANEAKIELPPITERGLPGQVVEAAWSEFGGNQQSADFWEAFSEGVRFSIRALASPLPEGRADLPDKWDAAAGLDASIRETFAAEDKGRADTTCTTCKGSGNLEIAGVWHQCHECEGSGVVPADIAGHRDFLTAPIDDRGYVDFSEQDAAHRADIAELGSEGESGNSRQRQAYRAMRAAIRACNEANDRAEAAEQALAASRAVVEQLKLTAFRDRAAMDLIGFDAAIEKSRAALAAHRPGSAKGGDA
jgi:hypothetical protein